MRCKYPGYWKRPGFLCGLLFLCATLSWAFIQNTANAQTEPTDIAELKRKAETGDAKAQTELGFRYGTGRGVRRDYVEAVHWYRKAAEQGFPRGQYNLGVMYQNGLGVNMNPLEAVRWYRKAAEQGDRDAQWNLGWMYMAGSGVNKDPTEAMKWMHKAAEQGDHRGQHALGIFYEKGPGKDPAMAVEWYRKAARQGNKLSQEKLKAMGVPFKEVREEDTKPSQAAVSEPSLTIHRVTIKPAKVLAGSKFKMITEYTVHDEKNKRRKVSVRYRYRILKGGKSLFEKKDITLKKCNEGATCETIERMIASNKRGTYAIVVTLTYRGRVAEKKVEFRIE